MLRNIKVKMKLLLLVAIFVIGFILFGFISWRTIEVIKVNGGLYEQIILGKDVIADILPPPEYIIETHLTSFELLSAKDSSTIESLVKKDKKLEQEFEKYHTLLEKKLPEGELKNQLIVTAYDNAKTYYQFLNDEFIPAIQKGDKTEAENILNTKMTPAYLLHRSAIDKVVILANKQNAKIEQDTSKRVLRDIMILVVVALIIIIAANFLCIFVIRSITTPIRILTGHIKVVSTGDLRGEIPSKLLDRKDELGDIANATNTMQDAFKGVVGQMKHMSNEVVGLSTHIEEAASTSGKASEEIATSVSTIAEGALTQDRDIKEIKRQIEDSVLSVEHGFLKADEMVTLAKDLSVIAQTGSSDIMDVIEQFTWVSKTVEYATDSIQNLGMRSKEIESITGVITGIASQTNLLALNASIEAARAGEAGKGFAIVAEEIRQLSESTALAAKQIAELIDDIQLETNQSVKNMESNLERVNTQMDSVQSGGQALKRVVDQVKRNEEDAKDIYNLYTQIQKKIEHINTTTSKMATIVSDNAAFAEEVAAASEQQYSTMEEITGSTGELALIAKKLQDQVDRFLSE